MANYTIELRSIIEGYAAREDPTVKNLRKQIKLARPYIFDFDYFIFDEQYREGIEENILASYAFEEIAHETVAKWQFYLENWFVNNFDKYNKLYEAHRLYGDKLIYDQYSIDKSLTDIINDTTTQQDTTSKNTETTDVDTINNNFTDTDSTSNTTSDTKAKFEGKELNSGNVKATDVVDNTSNVTNQTDVNSTDTINYLGKEITNSDNDIKSSASKDVTDAGSSSDTTNVNTLDTTVSDTDTHYKGVKSNEQKGTRTTRDLDKQSLTTSELLDDSYEVASTTQTGATEESYDAYVNEESFLGRTDSTNSTSTSTGKSDTNSVGTTTLNSNTIENSKQNQVGLNTKSFLERQDIKDTTLDTTSASNTLANTTGVRDTDSLNTKEFLNREDNTHVTGVATGRTIADTHGMILSNTQRVADMLSNLNTLGTSNTHNNYIAERYGWTTAPVNVLAQLAKEYKTINQMIIEDIAELFMQLY